MTFPYDHDAIDAATEALAAWAKVDESELAGASEYQQSNGQTAIELPDGRAFHIFESSVCTFELDGKKCVYTQEDGSSPIEFEYNGIAYAIYAEFDGIAAPMEEVRAMLDTGKANPCESMAIDPTCDAPRWTHWEALRASPVEQRWCERCGAMQERPYAND